jgi:hypothetical protein
VGLPTIVEELLVDVVADGFVLYCCGPKAAPYALVTCHDWDHYACVDLVTVRDFDRVVTARVPTRGVVDIFAPVVVVWAYEGPPQPALRALLALVHPAHPAHPEAPTLEYPAPAGLHVPRSRQRPMADPAALTRPGRGAGCPTRRGGAHSTPVDRAGRDAAPAGHSRPRDRRLAIG